MVSFIKNRSVNSGAELNTNFPVDLRRSMKTRGQNPSLGPALYYDSCLSYNVFSDDMADDTLIRTASTSIVSQRCLQTGEYVLSLLKTCASRSTTQKKAWKLKSEGFWIYSVSTGWMEEKWVLTAQSPPPSPIGRICPVQSHMLPGDSNK